MPIQILPARLANQIAAGEVVERPASVVKELVENSLDSGAKKIEIEIEKGGHKRILIRDNGAGIPEQELTLALSRHATSKITCLDDLEAICSLGFRGEALASISSVARLTITSKPQSQKKAWQAHCEGRDMQVQVNPVAHPDGTSVEVADLFFNTPARRKFLKTEKTEFSHIDEIVRRIALSRFDVGFTLKHNGKVLRNYPAIGHQGDKRKRLDSVCGKGKYPECVELHSQYQDFELTGWFMPLKEINSAPEYQYFYVNGRVMRDKLINHAIRQTLEELDYPNLSLAYVLYFTLPAEQLDVNVHPAKHEVRFHQGRLVHDFIYRALIDGLKQCLINDQAGESNSIAVNNELPPAIPNHDYIQPLKIEPNRKINEAPVSYGSAPASNASEGAFTGSQSRQTYSRAHSSSSVSNREKSESYQRYQDLMKVEYSEINRHRTDPGQWLRIDEKSILIWSEQQHFIVLLKQLHFAVLAHIFEHALPVSQPLLMPVSISADAMQLETAKKLYKGLLASSVEIGWTSNRILLRKVPALLRHFIWADCMQDLIRCDEYDEGYVRKHLLSVIVIKNSNYTNQFIQQLWNEFVNNQTDLVVAINQIGKTVPLAKWLNEHE